MQRRYYLFQLLRVRWDSDCIDLRHSDLVVRPGF